MKNKFLLILATVIAAVCLSGCENTLKIDSYALEGTFTINAMLDGQVSTKATETTAANLSTIKLQMFYDGAAYTSADTYNVGSTGVITSTNTVYYWPSTGDVTFKSVAAPTTWADISLTGITKTGYSTTTGVAQDDPVVAVTKTNKVVSVPVTFYHALSRVQICYCGTAYANDASKGIYIVPVSQQIYANVSGDFSYTGDNLEGKWADGRTDASKYLLAGAWSNQTAGWTAAETYTTLTTDYSATGANPTGLSTFANVVPGDGATKVKITINVKSSADGTIITENKVLELDLPAIHTHTHNTPGSQDVNDYENGSTYDSELITGGAAETANSLTGGKFQPGYGYIYDIKFNVKKGSGTDPGTDDDYDIDAIVIATIAVDPWNDAHAGEIVYGK